METTARWLGIALQSLLVGGLLAVAVLELMTALGAEALFHYQGF